MNYTNSSSPWGHKELDTTEQLNNILLQKSNSSHKEYHCTRPSLPESLSHVPWDALQYLSGCTVPNLPSSTRMRSPRHIWLSLPRCQWVSAHDGTACAAMSLPAWSEPRKAPVSREQVWPAPLNFYFSHQYKQPSYLPKECSPTCSEKKNMLNLLGERKWRTENLVPQTLSF